MYINNKYYFRKGTNVIYLRAVCQLGTVRNTVGTVIRNYILILIKGNNPNLNVCIEKCV